MKVYIFFLSFCFFKCVNINENKNQRNVPNKKDCLAMEECHQCTFIELKNNDECQLTGYKKRFHCIFENSEETYYSESCNENIKINSVYYFFFFCAILGIVTYVLQKNQKEYAIKNVMIKLSIFKDK